MKILCRAPLLVAATRALVATSPPVVKTTKVDVFIESTDAFQVVFYANYFKFFQYGLDESSEERVFLSSVDDMKYKDAAVLGDELEVRTIGLEEEPGYFEQSIVRARDGAVLIRAKTGTPWRARIEPIVEEEGVETTVHKIRFDDIDAETHGLSLDAALRGFERGRSDRLGGPDALKELQESDVTVVVCRVDNLRYSVEQERVQTRDTALFRTACRLRSNRFIVFEQEAFCGCSSSSSSPVARATVTCVCLDSLTGKPTAVPEKLRMKL